jgi:acetyl esterase/lipase
MTFAAFTWMLVAALNLLLSWFVLFRLHQPTALALWGAKVIVCALAPLLFLVGLFTAIAGWLTDLMPTIILGALSSLIYLIYTVRVVRPPEPLSGFEGASGRLFWNEKPLDKWRAVPSRRYVLVLPGTPEPTVQQDIPYYTVPGTNRDLLCDIWQPSPEVAHSGLAFIYLHGSAWTSLDKDFGTRTFFRLLANQGHVIMDVAYRLFPETDFDGMLHDTKQAIAWMKKNAAEYKVDPECIVVGGGSAGAHLALLAAYTNRVEALTPIELRDSDCSVRGVVSLYGQSDLIATYFHTAQHVTLKSGLRQRKKEQRGRQSWVQKRMEIDLQRLGFDKDVEPGMLSPILGGDPSTKPERYACYSPINYVDGNCPATLLIHGEHDILAPPEAIRKLKAKLDQAGVPVVMHLIPQTDHAFDLIFPRVSPSAHNAIYDVRIFLAAIILDHNVSRQGSAKSDLSKDA